MDPEQLRELEELLQKMSDEMDRHSRVLANSSRAYADLIKSIKNTNDKTEDFAKGIKDTNDASTRLVRGWQNLGRASVDLAESMYQGAQGAAVFSDAVNAVTKILQIGAIVALGKFGGAAAAVTAALGAFAVKSLQQSDDLFAAYQELARSGAAASDGMQGIGKDLMRMGLGIKELGDMTRIVRSNSVAFAALGNTAEQGRRQFAELAEAVVRSEIGEGFLLLGQTIPEINENLAYYVSLQIRSGITQERLNRLNSSLVETGTRFNLELDALQKATGVQRKDIEQQIEIARSEQRFRSVLEEMRASGDLALIEQADKLEAGMGLIATQSPELAKGLRDVMTGFIGTEEAAQVFRLIGPDVMTATQGIKTGALSVEEGLGQILSSAQATAESERSRSFARMGVFDQIFGSFGGILDSTRLLENLSERIAEARAQEAGVREDPETGVAAQVRLRIAQMNVRTALQDLVRQGVNPTTSALARLAGVAGNLATAVDESVTGRRGIGATEPGGLGNWFSRNILGRDYMLDPTEQARRLLQQSDQTVPEYRTGGIARGPDSGHLNMLHGVEAVVPLPDGETIPVNLSGANTQSIATAINNFADKISGYDVQIPISSAINEFVERLANLDVTVNVDTVSEAVAAATPATPTVSPLLTPENMNTLISNMSAQVDLLKTHSIKLDEMVSMMRQGNMINNRILQMSS